MSESCYVYDIWSHLFMLPLAIFFLTTDRGKSATREFRSFPLLLPLRPSLRKGAEVSRYCGFRFLGRIGFLSANRRECSAVRYSNTTRIRFSSAGRKEKEKNKIKIKIMAECLVALAYTHVHTHACTIHPTGGSTCNLPLSKADFFCDKIPAKHEAAIRASQPAWKMRSGENLFGKSRLPQSSVRRTVSACAWVVEHTVLYAPPSSVRRPLSFSATRERNIIFENATDSRHLTKKKKRNVARRIFEFFVRANYCSKLRTMYLHRIDIHIQGIF